MFSFHKPKVYRSINGCCICCAKSSSSRFTDSSKYEMDFYKCFRIMEPRQGEICNACVLLVKRWQKLPSGSTRNWHHVVDARAGPGSKSITKIKNKAEQALNSRKQKCVKSAAERALQNANRHHREQCSREGMEDLHVKRTRSSAYAPPPSPTFSDNSDDVEMERLLAGSKISSFLDLSYWKCTQVCCGVIFKGQNGEVMVDQNLLRPCSHKKKPNDQTPSLGKASISNGGDRHSDGESNHSNESSRDGGYDETVQVMDACHVPVTYQDDDDDDETDIDDMDDDDDFDDDDLDDDLEETIDM